MRSEVKAYGVELDSITLQKGESITVNIGPKVKVVLRLTGMGQPEIWTDHSMSIVRPFEWWYELNEYC